MCKLSPSLIIKQKTFFIGYVSQFTSWGEGDGEGEGRGAGIRAQEKNFKTPRTRKIHLIHKRLVVYGAETRQDFWELGECTLLLPVEVEHGAQGMVGDRIHVVQELTPTAPHPVEEDLEVHIPESHRRVHVHQHLRLGRHGLQGEGQVKGAWKQLQPCEFAVSCLAAQKVCDECIWCESDAG